MKRRKWLGLLLAAVMVLTMVPTMAFAQDSTGDSETEKITVSIGDLVTEYDTFDDAMAAVRTADDEAKKTITLPAGKFKAADAETFRINEPNTTIIGAGADQTTINTESFAVSGQAGILIQADNVTIQDLKVVSANPGASGGAIKATLIGTADNLPYLNNVKISNVVIWTDIGYGLNLHGVNDATISNVIIEKAGKASVSLAKAQGVSIDGLTTRESGWKTDIAIQYKADSAAYNDPSDVKITNSSFKYNTIYSERPASEEDSGDTITIVDENLIVATNSDGTKAVVEKANAIMNADSGKAYLTIQAAIDDAEADDVINVPAGKYQENISANKAISIIGAGKGETIIKFDKETKQKQSYFSGDAYPVVYSTAALILEDLTVEGPTDAHHGIDGILAKDDLTMNNVAVKDIRCTADGGKVCGVQYGKGVIVDGDGDVTIENCEIVDFQKQAIDIKTSGKAIIKNNTIKGIGENSIIAQNGIVLRGATEATVEGNTISDLRYTADNEWTDASYAVIAMHNVDLNMTKNTIERVDNGVDLEGSAAAKINNNIIDADNYGLVVYSDADSDVADNYWGGELYIDPEAGKVTGQDDVKTEPVISEPGEDETTPPEQPSENPDDPTTDTDKPVVDPGQPGDQQGNGGTDQNDEKPSAESDRASATGDDFNMAVPIAAAGLALAAMIAVVATRRRHN